MHYMSFYLKACNQQLASRVAPGTCTPTPKPLTLPQLGSNKIASPPCTPLNERCVPLQLPPPPPSSLLQVAYETWRAVNVTLDRWRSCSFSSAPSTRHLSVAASCRHISALLFAGITCRKKKKRRKIGAAAGEGE